jgi:hypothetical protein
MFDIWYSLFGRRKRRKIAPPRRAAAPPLALQPSTAPRAPLATTGPTVLDARSAALRDAFTPTRPQRSLRRLVGRKQELHRILEVIAEDRNHVVVYGDRGRGKTSVANLVAASARRYGYSVGRYSCADGSDFDEIVRGLARDLPRSLLAAPVVEDYALEGCEAALPRSTLLPRDVVQFHGRLTGGNLLLVIDDFERVLHAPTRTRLADTLKQVSDRCIPLSFLITGVADSLDELLGWQPSIQRSVVGVPLPLLTDDDAQEILDLGAASAGLVYPHRICDRITHFACGSPYVVHLLALHAGRRALARGADSVSEADFRGAVEQAAAEMDPRIRALYEQLTHGGLDLRMKQLLLTRARGPHEGLARFRVQDVWGELQTVDHAGQPARWTHLTDEGEALPASHATGHGHHTISEPLLLNYALLTEELETQPHHE